MEGQFAGKVALVTGGGSGIGRASSLAFAQVGARVVVADIDAPGGEATAQMVADGGGEGLFVRTDVALPDEVAALVARTVERFGRLDCALNNAGIEGEALPPHEYPDDVWARVLAVNLTGVFLCLKHEVRQMLAQGGGAIVNVASIAGLRGAPRRPAYGASKHGVVGLTRSAALAYARAGIRVNAVCPGLTNTAMAARHPEVAALAAQRVPDGRMATPEEVAAAAMWLCSEAAAHVTGVALPVDGGSVA
jgi:NAD(P)-dependent dehydrogenase (short-subunit alcohol dehydrogenase family)